MKLIIKSATIIDINSEYHLKIKDILIIDGIISEINDQIAEQSGCIMIEHENVFVSPGWVDLQSHHKDPGFEQKESIGNLCQAAAFGGFTKAVVLPSTLPVTQSKSQIEYTINTSKDEAVQLLPLGAITSNLEGKEITEMYDMHTSGAIAFSDCMNPIMNSGVMLRALTYVKQFNGLLMVYAEDKNLSDGTKVNEGINSTLLGMKGRPSIAEQIAIERDIALTTYSDSKIHFNCISSSLGVNAVATGKLNINKISASVAAYHLLLDDESLKTFDTNYKVIPPLRSSEDKDALKAAVLDGTIDCIVSNHTPEELERKAVEFDYAAYGIIGLETSYAITNTALDGKLSPEKTVELFSSNPRKILNLEKSTIKIGTIAELTLFDPDFEWTFRENDIKSKSKNTPFIGSKFKGKTIGIISRGQVILNQ